MAKSSEKIASDWISAEDYNQLREDAAGVTLVNQGDILYMGSAGLEKLAPGSPGQWLKCQGSGSPPVWATYP